MKKLLSAICAVLLLAATLTGCGTPAAPEAAAINTLDDLNGKRIGVQLGTVGDSLAESEVTDAKVERYNKGADAVIALQQGKIDAVIIDDQPAKVFVSQNSDLKILEQALTEESYAICISKEKPELTAAFNTAIAELKADGTLQALFDYYINKTEGSAPYTSPAGLDYSNGLLVMATNAEFPPYEYIEDNTIKGFDADMAKAICDKLGYDLRIDNMNFDTIITAVQSGKADFGAAGMTVDEDRLKNIDFTDSYCTATQVIIVKK